MRNERPVLLVEDNPDDVELTLRALKKHKVSNQIIIVRDGAEALDWLLCAGKYAARDSSVRPAVVLLDLKLPKVGGLDVLKRIRSEESIRLLPVVILTTSNEHRDILESYSNGCNSYVRKPVDFGQFAEAVRQLGLYWLLLNEMPPDAD